MAQFDDITEAALGNFGLITAAQAAEMGVRSKDIAEWVRLGRLERRGWGVYRIAHYVPSDFDQYAEAVALVGGDAVVWGESVLAMLNLALVNPLRVSVATGRRVRRRLPDWIRLVRKPKGAESESIEGVPSQRLADAFRECRGRVMAERLSDAVREAGRKGLLGAGDARRLGRELRRSAAGSSPTANARPGRRPSSRAPNGAPPTKPLWKPCRTSPASFPP